MWKTEHLKHCPSVRATSAGVVRSDHVTHERLTALNPGKRRTAEAVSNGNGRNCFMPSEVWTAGMAGRTRAGMRPFWHVLPVGGRAKRQHVELQTAAETRGRARSLHAHIQVCVCSVCVTASLFALRNIVFVSHSCVSSSAHKARWFDLKRLPGVKKKNDFPNFVECLSSDTVEIPQISSLDPFFNAPTQKTTLNFKPLGAFSSFQTQVFHQQHFVYYICHQSPLNFLCSLKWCGFPGFDSRG